MTTRDWRVAVVGAGPAGLYGASALRKRGARVDVFEREFAPFGLVRYGVAPDHQKIKRTQLAFEKILAEPGVRYFGNVAVGKDLSVEQLLSLYDQVLITIGSSGARPLQIPGEALPGNHSATALVGWYNAQPRYTNLDPDLDCEHAVIVGMGNVAIDVARILVRKPEELALTDLPDYALSALQKSRIRKVTLLARRGQNQAAFDEKEVRALAELSGVHLSVTGYASKRKTKMSEFLSAFPRELDPAAERNVVLHFCASPKLVLGETRVTALRVESNVLMESAASMRAVGKGEFFDLSTGLVVGAIGYQAARLVGVPFVEETGTVPHDCGRVLSDQAGKVVKGLYVAGWIKRGPTGLIGTNKACATATVEVMERDLDQVGPARDDGATEALLSQATRAITWEDWKRLDAHEMEAGVRTGRPRVKLWSTEDALSVLDRC